MYQSWRFVLVIAVSVLCWACVGPKKYEKLLDELTGLDCPHPLIENWPTDELQRVLSLEEDGDSPAVAVPRDYKEMLSRMDDGAFRKWFGRDEIRSVIERGDPDALGELLKDRDPYRHIEPYSISYKALEVAARRARMVSEALGNAMPEAGVSLIADVTFPIDKFVQKISFILLFRTGMTVIPRKDVFNYQLCVLAREGKISPEEVIAIAGVKRRPCEWQVDEGHLESAIDYQNGVYDELLAGFNEELHFLAPDGGEGQPEIPSLAWGNAVIRRVTSRDVGEEFIGVRNELRKAVAVRGLLSVADEVSADLAESLYDFPESQASYRGAARSLVELKVSEVVAELVEIVESGGEEVFWGFVREEDDGVFKRLATFNHEKIIRRGVGLAIDSGVGVLYVRGDYLLFVPSAETQRHGVFRVDDEKMKSWVKAVCAKLLASEDEVRVALLKEYSVCNQCCVITASEAEKVKRAEMAVWDPGMALGETCQNAATHVCRRQNRKRIEKARWCVEELRTSKRETMQSFREFASGIREQAGVDGADMVCAVQGGASQIKYRCKDLAMDLVRKVEDDQCCVEECSKSRLRRRVVAGEEGFGVECVKRRERCGIEDAAELRSLDIMLLWDNVSHEVPGCSSEGPPSNDRSANPALADLRAWSIAKYLKRMTGLDESRIQIDWSNNGEQGQRWSVTCSWKEEGVVRTVPFHFSGTGRLCESP